VSIHRVPPACQGPSEPMTAIGEKAPDDLPIVFVILDMHGQFPAHTSASDRTLRGILK